MFSESHIAAALTTMLRRIEPTPVPLEQVRLRYAQRQRTSRNGSRFYLPAAAAVAVFFVLAMPVVAPGLAQTIETKIATILHWTSPPPAPVSVELAMRSQTRTLAQAQSHVDFRIVAPVGVPTDVISQKIATTPIGVYSKITHSWSIGPPNVWFTYQRADGRSFRLMAERLDPRAGPPTRYIYQDMDRMQNGHEVLVRHELFAWRNGEQIMTAVAGDGISAGEIVAIRSAMHGVPFQGVWPPPRATIEKQYRLP